MVRREPDHPAMRSVPPGPPTFEDRWRELDEPSRRCLELAWQSTCAGSLGIGAVVTDGDGTVVATGRNRLYEREPGDDHLAGSPVAHAEMNALGKLRAGVDHEGFTLWTSLEPCLLCAGGIRLAQIGSVRFLAADPLWSAARGVPDLDPFIGSAWPEVHGPTGCELATFATLLPLHAAVFWRPGGELEQAWRLHAPRVVELARELVESHELVALAAARAPVQEVIGELWSRLESATA